MRPRGGPVCDEPQGWDMAMKIWRKFEFRGRDPNDNPFLDFGFVESDGRRYALTSHMLREPLWVDREPHVLPTFKAYFESQGFTQLRYKVLWDDDGPVDTPFEEGWAPLEDGAHPAITDAGTGP
jgi:hypothetical protein